MKKLSKGFKLMVIACTMILLTGCVKYDMTMNITKEDVKVGLIYAMQSSYVTDSTMFDETKKEAKEKGYTVEDYKDDDYNNEPNFSWKENGDKLYSNWVNFYLTKN